MPRPRGSAPVRTTASPSDEAVLPGSAPGGAPRRGGAEAGGHVRGPGRAIPPTSLRRVDPLATVTRRPSLARTGSVPGSRTSRGRAPLAKITAGLRPSQKPSRVRRSAGFTHMPRGVRPCAMAGLVQIGSTEPKPRGTGEDRFLPTNLREARARGWDELDVVLVNGDAYVDHPTFGVPLIGRLLAARGFRVGIVSQPRWDDASGLVDFAACGRPRLFFGVSSGNMDAMVNHYTAGKKRRSSDAYTPDAAPGKRPDYATAIYARKLKRLFPDVPIVIR